MAERRNSPREIERVTLAGQTIQRGETGPVLGGVLGGMLGAVEADTAWFFTTPDDAATALSFAEWLLRARKEADHG